MPPCVAISASIAAISGLVVSSCVVVLVGNFVKSGVVVVVVFVVVSNDSKRDNSDVTSCERSFSSVASLWNLISTCEITHDIRHVSNHALDILTHMYINQ